MQSDYVFGNHIYLQIDQTDCNEFDKNYIAKIKENSPVWIAWFGRMICTSLVKKQIISDSNYIQILLRSFGDKHIFALPRINGCVNHEKCIIQIKKQEADYPVFFTYKAVVKDIYMYERKE